MNITARSHLTAGLAAFSVGAIALSPLQPLPDQAAPAQERAVSNLAVTLASTIDPITPWVDTFKLAAENIKQLAAFYAEKPFPLLQTVGANIGTYFNELTNGNAGLIPGQIRNNINTFFYSPWWNRDGATIVNDTFSADYISNTQTRSGLSASLFNSQRGAYNLTAPILAGQLGDAGPALVQFTSTPYSGQLIGLLSPLLSSVVQLTRSFTAVSQYWQNGDLTGAINELINIPANVTNASLNGAGLLDLTAVALPLLPPAVASLVRSLGVQLGGTLSPPVPFNGSLTAANNPPTQFTGGTLFDAVQATTNPVAGIGGNTTGLPVGWAGSVIGLGQFLGQKMLVTPPPPATAAALAPKAAAVEAAPAPVSEPTPGETTPSEPQESAAVPVVDAPVVEAPKADAPDADAPKASGHRGGGGGDNGGHSGGKGHRGAA